MKKIMKHTATMAKKSVLVVAGAAASASAFAVDHSAAINGAYADGNTNVTAAVVGLIALMAVIVGIGAIIGLFKRG